MQTDLVIFTHGTLGEVLYETTAMILGKQEGVVCLSTGNRGPDDLLQAVKRVVQSALRAGHYVVIAVDLKGGNTWNIACKIAHENENIRVISGINLGMLLSFFTKRNNDSLDQFVKVLVTDGNRHIDHFPQHTGKD